MNFMFRVIAPYKGELEMWYQRKRSFILDLELIFLTAWVILFPSSHIFEKMFDDLPKKILKNQLVFHNKYQ